MKDSNKLVFIVSKCKINEYMLEDNKKNHI